MTTQNRRYDIDWLRVIAIGLLLVYHIAIVFQPWGVLIGFMQSSVPLLNLWKPMQMLNVWRIPLLFYVSGMGVGFAMRKRNLKQLLLERTTRILVPFLFGILAIVPLHVFVWQHYYHQDMKYTVNFGHLWFLANIFCYVLIIAPAYQLLSKKKQLQVKTFLERLYRTPVGLVLVTGCFVIEAVLMNPDSFELYAMTLHGFILGFLAFLAGFTFIISEGNFWKSLVKWRWYILIPAILLYLLRITVFLPKAPNAIIAVESNLWIFAILGFATKHLNKPGKALRYLSQAAYPIYILHMVYLFLTSSFILPLQLSAELQFILIVAFTFLLCFGTYEIIRRTKILRPLFGLKV